MTPELTQEGTQESAQQTSRRIRINILSHAEWCKTRRAERNQLELQRIRKGLCPREDKIQILENLLFTCVQDGEPTEEIAQAIQILQENKVLDEELWLRQENTFWGQMSRVGNFVMSCAIAVTITSLIALPVCSNSESGFCKAARVIPEALNNFFREPKPPSKSRILPPILP